MTALDLRRIGPSDYSALCGCDEYRTPEDLWRRIVLCVDAGLAPDAHEAARWGQRLERVVYEAWCEAMGIGPSVALYNLSCVSKTRLWSRHTPDFVRLLEPLVCQVKTISKERFKRERDQWGEDGSADVPERILLQVTGEIEAMRADAAYWLEAGVDPFKLDRSHVAVLVGGNKLRRFEVPYDPDLGALLVQTAERFWRDHVLTKTPPIMEPVPLKRRRSA